MPNNDSFDALLNLNNAPKQITPASKAPLGRSIPDLPYNASFDNLQQGQLITPENYQARTEEVAKEQSIPTLMGHALTQAAIGEVVGGTLEGIGALNPSTLIGRLSGDKDAFDRNFLESIGNDVRTYSQNVAPIYQTQVAQNGLSSPAALLDASWWANMFPSMASSISMLIPATGVSTLAKMLGTGTRALKGLAELSEVGQATKAAVGIGELGTTAEVMANTGFGAWKAAKYAEEIDALSKGINVGKIVGTAQNVVLPALASRTIDSSREAVGRYQQNYQAYKNYGFTDDKAKQLAGDAAHYGFVTSHGNILFDLAEWTILSKLGEPAKEGLEGMMTKALGRNSAYNDMVGGAADAMLDNKPLVKKLMGEVLPEYLKTGMMEGLDETAMDFFMDDAQRKVERDNGLRPYNQEGSMLERYIKHHAVGNNWESFIGGALGGIASGAIMHTYGSVRNQYFNEEGNTRIENIANDFVERTKNTSDYIKQYNDSKSNGQINTAHALRSQIVNTILQGSALTGTLNLDVEHLENALKLPDDQKAQLEMFQDKDGNYIKDSSKGIEDLVTDLKKYKNIYDVEMATPRTGDKNTDRYISAEVAAIKTHIGLNNDAIKSLTKTGEGNRTSDELNNQTREMTSNLGDTNSELYNSLSKYESTKINTENNNGTILQSIQGLNDIIEDLQNKIPDLETKLKSEHDSIARSALTSQIDKIKSSIDIYNSNIDSANKTVNDNNNSLKLLKQEHDDFIANKKLVMGDKFDDIFNKVKDIHKTYNTEKSYLDANGTSVVQILKNQNTALQSQLNGKVNKEYYVKKKTEIDNLQNLRGSFLVNDFNKTISKIDNLKDLEDQLDTLKVNTLDDETRDKLMKVYNKRKSDIISKQTKESNVTEKPASTQEESITKISKSEVEVNRDKSIASIKNKKLSLGKLNVGKDAYVFDYTKDGILMTSKTKDSEGNVLYKTKEEAIEAINKLYDSQIPTEDTAEVYEDSPESVRLPSTGDSNEITKNPNESLVNNKGLEINIGDRLYTTDVSTGEVISNIPLSVKNIDYETNIVTMTGTDNTKEYSVYMDDLSKLYGGQKVQNNQDFETELISKVLEHSKSVYKNEQDHTYSYQGQQNTVSGSQLLQTVYSDNQSGESQATNVGSSIDRLYRDYFSNEGIKDKSEYGIISNEEYNHLIDYLGSIKREFDLQGIRVIANGVKLFDKETGIAGEIDLLCIDKTNRVYIFDTKTKLMTGEKHNFFATKNGYNSFHSNIIQVNTYAALFEKIHGYAVDGLGIIPISVKYNAKGKVEETPEINRIQPAKFNNVSDIANANKIANEDINVYNKNLDAVEKIANVVVSVSNGMIRFNPNIVSLTATSTNGKSILERLNINETPLTADNLTNDELISKYSELLDYLKSKNATNTTNVPLNKLYTLLNQLFSIEKINGEYNIVPTDYVTNQVIYESVLPNSDLGDTINVLYSTNKEYFDTLFKNDYLSSGRVKNQLSQVMQHLNVLYNNHIYYTILPFTNSKSVTELKDQQPEINDKSQQIINTINDLQSYSLHDNSNFFIHQQKNINLALQLLQLKQYLQINTNPTLSISDGIKLILTAYDNVNSDSPINIDDLIPTFVSLNNVLSNIKVETNSRRQYLIENELRSLQKLDSNIRWNKNTKSFQTLDNEDNIQNIPWENDTAFKQYTFLNNLYSNIIIDKNAFNNPETRDYIKTDYIKGIISKYNKPQSESNKYFNITLNPNLNVTTDKFGGISNPEAYELINGLQNGSAVNLVKTDKGISVMVGTTDLTKTNSLLGTIPDISKQINNITISKDGKQYIGFTPLIENLNKNTELLNTDVLEHLRKLQVARLTTLSNNKSNVKLATNTSLYNSLVSIVTNKVESNTLGANIRNLIDEFTKLNNDEFKSHYDIDTINSVLDVLFFGSNLNFMDDYKVSSVDALNRIKYYDNTTKSNYNKFAIYNSIVNNDTSIASIKNISKPSILFINTTTKPILNDTIKVTKSETNPEGKVQLLNIRKGVMSDTRGLLNPSTLNINNKNDKADGLYVMLQSTDNSYTLSPIRQNTLKESYARSLMDDTNYKPLDYAKKVIKNILFSNYNKDSVNFQVGDRISDNGAPFRSLSFDERDIAHETINNNITNIIKTNRFKNIVICKNTADTNDYPYFKAFSTGSIDGTDLVTFVMYKTFANGVEMLHNIRVKGDRLTYTNSDITNSKNISDRIKYMKGEHINEIYRNDEFNLDLNSDTDLDKLDEVLDSLGGLLRQTNYGENGIVNFSTNSKEAGDETFTDPITNITYDNATDHALNTQAVYNYIGNVHDEQGNILTNMDLFGNNKLRFDIDSEGVTSIKKGEIDNPLNTIPSNTEFKELVGVINNIDEQLNKDFEGKVIATHKGYTDVNPDVIANITPIKNFDGSLTFDYGYTDNFINSLYNKSKINNPLVSILHEHIHSVIISAVNLAKNIEQKEVLIKHNNDLVQQFLTSFKKDFDNNFYSDKTNFTVNDEFVSELKKQFDITSDATNTANTKIRNLVTNIIGKIQNDLDKTNENFKDGKRDDSALAQELYTYFSNPFVMSVFSKTKNTEFNYDRNENNKGTFIDKLVDLLMSVYNKILSTLNINTTDNYTKSVKDMLSDLYYAMSNDTKQTINTTQTETQEIKTETPIENKEDIIEDMPTNKRNRRNVELLVSNLDSQNINSIFANRSLSTWVENSTDDSNLKLC